MEPRQLGMEESYAVTAAEVLKPVETPSNGEGCPICFGQEEAAATAWKETACGHSFHGRCVERWLETKGTCPMCRRQLLVPPIVTQRHIRLPNPMMTMALEILGRYPEIYSSETYQHLRQIHVGDI
ncbi:hypothetical protein ACQJBY_026248 [Aegilops geniculata]